MAATAPHHGGAPGYPAPRPRSLTPECMPAQVCAWLCSPCMLEGKPGAPAGGASGGVCIQLAGCAAAALGELTTRLLAFPAAWVEELLSTLALTLARRRAQSAALPRVVPQLAMPASSGGRARPAWPALHAESKPASHSARSRRLRCRRQGRRQGRRQAADPALSTILRWGAGATHRSRRRRCSARCCSRTSSAAAAVRGARPHGCASLPSSWPATAPPPSPRCSRRSVVRGPRRCT